MKNEKQEDRAHRKKMDDARPVEIAEEHGEGLELTGFQIARPVRTATIPARVTPL